jgi:putative endonuclease
VPHFIYILTCHDGTYYIGRTNNITKRLRAHNGEIAGGAKYTKPRRPVRVVYVEEHQTLSDALKREYALKQLTRPQKEALIKKVQAGTNPRLYSKPDLNNVI